MTVTDVSCTVFAFIVFVIFLYYFWFLTLHSMYHYVIAGIILDYMSTFLSLYFCFKIDCYID